MKTSNKKNSTLIEQQKEVKKLLTDNEKYLFIGSLYDEEYYLDMNSDFKGWSFMGLRPNTEKELRERQRDIDPSDYVTIPDFFEKYFDYEAFRDDMEEQWEENNDVQATRTNENGEILHLGFGSGTDIYHYFSDNKINSYESYVKHFETIGLTNKEFISLMKKLKIKISTKL